MPVSDLPRLLLIEDDPETLTWLSGLLHSRYTLRVATSVARGRVLAHDPVAPPDIVLMDGQLPDGSGAALCAELAAEPATAGIPVVFLSGGADRAAEHAAFAAGAADYIRKPADPDLLQARLAVQLRHRRAEVRVREERRRSELLLDSVLPAGAAEELRRAGRIAPRRVDGVAVLFCDVVGFTRWCDRTSPEQVVPALDNVFREMEHLCRAHGVDKIKTIGDGFMATAGLLGPAADAGARAFAVALGADAVVGRAHPGWRMRAGVHVGPVVAGVVGDERTQYDLWGDTVNLAARLCGVAPPGGVAALPGLAPSWAPPGRPARVTLKGKGTVDICLWGDEPDELTEEATGVVFVP